MFEYIKIVWRNIWRNRRRTIITAASVFFAIFLALLMRSFQFGTYNHMIDSMTKVYTGHIQVHAKGYWDDKTLDNTFVDSKPIHQKVQSAENVDLVIPRLETGALASSGEHTKGVLVIGVEPDEEKDFTGLDKKVVKGEYLSNEKPGVMVAKRLAGFLKLEVGDTLILLGQGYHGVTAAGKYPVRAIISFPSPEYDNKFVFMNLKSAQQMYSCQNRLTSYIVSVKDNQEDALYESVENLENMISTEKYEVMSWREMSEVIVQQIESDNASGKIMLGILYMIVTFGIFGTVLMMIAERRREFGVMIAVGMKKGKLTMIVTLEMIFIGIIGIISGILASIPIIYYYHVNPIRLEGEMAKSIENMGFDPVMPMALQTDFFIDQSIVVIILIAFACLYPLYAITRLKVISALRA